MSDDPAPSGPASAPDDEMAAVTATIEDYFLGWFDADAERMRRALHPDLAKRSHVIGRDGGPLAIRPVTADQMIGWTAAGEGVDDARTGRGLTIVVDEVHDSIATARVNSALYREYVHLARTPEGWRIVNTLWTWTDGDSRRP